MHTPDHTLTFFVDDEGFPATSHVLTVRQILEESGNTPPEQFCLYRLDGPTERHKLPSMDEEVHLHDGIRFSALFCGETPYSNGFTDFGARRLLQDLQCLGLSAEGPFPCQGNEELVLLRSYFVKYGRFLGRDVAVAIPVCGDFPASLPRGLFISPALLPSGTFNINDPGGATGALPGDGWLYWSRPFPQQRWQPQRPGLSILRHLDSVLADERFYAA